MALETDTAGTDPTDTISTMEQASNLATRLLHSAHREDGDMGLWRLIAAPLLAAILFDVSPAGAGGGIKRAKVIARHPDDSDQSGNRNWLTVAANCPDEHLAKRLRESSALEGSQRASIQAALGRALEGDYGEVRP
ncbi:Uncharacterised protein [Mycobacteroides abscessus subsp. abscessus]|uniref:hypothetical protein n=1 Tax=Mycobacteroides abscessus TaxID=36809 RepID=UPI00092BA914|nr:hypothetical protein [Mycobacteroides abscessus]SHS18601.1 Uncharacterised protein [Mycobacteroides abscessus subsp. abscessus]